MGQLSKRLFKELDTWTSECCHGKEEHAVLTEYAYEYCIRQYICLHFHYNTVTDELQEFLSGKSNILDYLYEEYVNDDMANVNDIIKVFINNMEYKVHNNECYKI
jgi:hypothetical protein